MDKEICPFMAPQRFRENYLQGKPCEEQRSAETIYSRLENISDQIMKFGLDDFPKLSGEYGKQVALFLELAWAAIAAQSIGKSHDE